MLVLESLMKAASPKSVMFEVGKIDKEIANGVLKLKKKMKMKMIINFEENDCILVLGCLGLRNL